MKAPFEALDAKSAKTFAGAVKALRAGKYDAARATFHQIVADHPDQTAARYQELRAAVLAGALAETGDLWRELLARDYVGYATKLETDKDFSSLRRSPQWPELHKVRQDAQAAYAHGLDRGLFFLARTRKAKPQLYDEKARPVLELNQEVFHFDPATGRVRRLTETGGHAFAIYRNRARKELAVLVLDAYAPSEVDDGNRFGSISAAVLSLQDLTMVGPFALPADKQLAEVILCSSSAGEPLWLTPGANRLDRAKRKAVPVEERCAPADPVAHVTPIRGEWMRAPPADVVLDPSQKTVTVKGAAPVRVERPIRAASVGWSPDKKRLVRAGDLDVCDLTMRYETHWPAAQQNQLDVWDAAQHKSTKTAKAFSFFEWEWLDDTHLAYETAGKSGRNVAAAVYDFARNTETVLDTRYGTGLVAVPNLTCVTRNVEEELDYEDDGAE